MIPGEARGTTSAGTVGLVALAINLVMPLSIIVLELTAAKSTVADTASEGGRSPPVVAGLKAGLTSPLLWAPVLGIAVVLAGIHLPWELASSLEMIGSATSGVDVFTVGLTLAAHSFLISPVVVLGTLGRISVQTLSLFGLFHLLNVTGIFAREALVCCSFPRATTIVLFAAMHRALEAETASVLLLSTVSLLVTVPLTVTFGN